MITHERHHRDHPNHGDDLPRTCPQCGRDEYTWMDGVCECGELCEEE